MSRDTCDLLRLALPRAEAGRRLLSDVVGSARPLPTRATTGALS